MPRRTPVEELQQSAETAPNSPLRRSVRLSTNASTPSQVTTRRTSTEASASVPKTTRSRRLSEIPAEEAAEETKPATRARRASISKNSEKDAPEDDQKQETTSRLRTRASSVTKEQPAEAKKPAPRRRSSSNAETELPEQNSLNVRTRTRSGSVPKTVEISASKPVTRRRRSSITASDEPEAVGSPIVTTLKRSPPGEGVTALEPIEELEKDEESPKAEKVVKKKLDMPRVDMDLSVIKETSFGEEASQGEPQASSQGHNGANEESEESFHLVLSTSQEKLNASPLSDKENISPKCDKTPHAARKEENVFAEKGASVANLEPCEPMEVDYLETSVVETPLKTKIGLNTSDVSKKLETLEKINDEVAEILSAQIQIPLDVQEKKTVESHKTTTDNDGDEKTSKDESHVRASPRRSPRKAVKILPPAEQIVDLTESVESKSVTPKKRMSLRKDDKFEISIKEVVALKSPRTKTEDSENEPGTSRDQQTVIVTSSAKKRLSLTMRDTASTSKEDGASKTNEEVMQATPEKIENVTSEASPLVLESEESATERREITEDKEPEATVVSTSEAEGASQSSPEKIPEGGSFPISQKVVVSLHANPDGDSTYELVETQDSAEAEEAGKAPETEPAVGENVTEKAQNVAAEESQHVSSSEVNETSGTGGKIGEENAEPTEVSGSVVVTDEKASSEAAEASKSEIEVHEESAPSEETSKEVDKTENLEISREEVRDTVEESFDVFKTSLRDVSREESSVCEETGQKEPSLDEEAEKEPSVCEKTGEKEPSLGEEAEKEPSVCEETGEKKSSPDEEAEKEPSLQKRDESFKKKVSVTEENSTMDADVAPESGVAPKDSTLAKEEIVSEESGADLEISQNPIQTEESVAVPDDVHSVSSEDLKKSEEGHAVIEILDDDAESKKKSAKSDVVWLSSDDDNSQHDKSEGRSKKKNRDDSRKSRNTRDKNVTEETGSRGNVKRGDRRRKSNAIGGNGDDSDSEREEKKVRPREDFDDSVEEESPSQKAKKFKRETNTDSPASETKARKVELQVIDSMRAEIAEQDNSEEVETGAAYLDTMAEEGEGEESPMEDDNEISDHGESVGFSDPQSDPDDSYEIDSFIDDEEHHDLLSGEEDYLTCERSSEIPDGHEDEGVRTRSKSNKKKKGRVIRPVDSSDEEGDKNSGREERADDQAPDAAGTEENGERQGEESAKDAEVITIESDAENDSASAEDVPKETSAFAHNVSDSSRKRSIIIHENIRVDDIENQSLSERIHQVVNLFCSSINRKGEVSVNVSLNYDGDAEEDHQEGSAKGARDKAKGKRASEGRGSRQEVLTLSSDDDVGLDTTGGAASDNVFTDDPAEVKRKKRDKKTPTKIDSAKKSKSRTDTSIKETSEPVESAKKERKKKRKSKSRDASSVSGNKEYSELDVSPFEKSENEIAHGEKSVPDRSFEQSTPLVSTHNQTIERAKAKSVLADITDGITQTPIRGSSKRLSSPKVQQQLERSKKDKKKSPIAKEKKTEEETRTPQNIATKRNKSESMREDRTPMPAKALKKHSASLSVSAKDEQKLKNASGGEDQISKKKRKKKADRGNEDGESLAGKGASSSKKSKLDDVEVPVKVGKQHPGSLTENRQKLEKNKTDEIEQDRVAKKKDKKIQKRAAKTSEKSESRDEEKNRDPVKKTKRYLQFDSTPAEMKAGYRKKAVGSGLFIVPSDQEDVLVTEEGLQALKDRISKKKKRKLPADDKAVPTKKQKKENEPAGGSRVAKEKKKKGRKDLTEDLDRKTLSVLNQALKEESYYYKRTGVYQIRLKPSSQETYDKWNVSSARISPSKANKKYVDKNICEVMCSKSEAPKTFHQKDFKNQTFHNPDRVKRTDTKEVLKKRRAKF